MKIGLLFWRHRELAAHISTHKRKQLIMRTLLLATAVAALGIAGCNQQSTTVKGKDGEKLTLTAPQKVSVNAGETVQFKVVVAREGFDDPVAIEFAQLPEGVTIVETDLKVAKGEKEATYTLKAADSAKGTGHAVKVSASSHGMKAGPEEFTVNIAEKKGPDISQKRKDLEKTIQAKVDEANKAIAALQQRAKEAQGAAKTEIDTMLVQMQKSRDGLEKRLEQARTTSAEAWDEFSRGVGDAVQEMQDASRRAWEKLKS